MIIRPAKMNDVAAIAELCKQHAEYEKSDIEVDHLAEKLSELLFKNQVIQCLVVEQADNLVGYASVMKQYSTWHACSYLYLDCLYLQEEARGKGLGMRLMQEIWQLAIKEECDHIQWQTPSFNKAAIGFYKKLGAVSKMKERFVWR
ncbi:GNAT family N-acetyltransferase [Fulvivirga ligni]|uniref:GNAT family N-acetyltransferase n=1 Tax=Fulvivirga ligni TaxID=2904246 RepID=UPI001F17D4AA|nr:GNAT family N-acetyltransferase [Fulvivirga ligni]UII20602.1 GNAT family N-acetyltransferase [Fulvivirga ligni]